MEMINPYDGLITLQDALDRDVLNLYTDFQRGTLHPDIYLFQEEGRDYIDSYSEKTKTYTKLANQDLV